MEYAIQAGISTFGASISDEESGQMVCDDTRFSVIQLPFNMANTRFGGIIDLAVQKGKRIIVNRPFNMGQIIAGEGQNVSTLAAFRYVLQKRFNGFILTGTKSKKHLKENIDTFAALL